MLESVERKSRTSELHYDMQEEDVTIGLMKLSELSLHDFLSSEPDIYTDKDLKVRYRLESQSAECGIYELLRISKNLINGKVYILLVP
jgi:hypothetical protein